MPPIEPNPDVDPPSEPLEPSLLPPNQPAYEVPSNIGSQIQPSPGTFPTGVPVDYSV